MQSEARFSTTGIGGVCIYERFALFRAVLVIIAWFIPAYLGAPAFVTVSIVASAAAICGLGPSRLVYRGKIVGIAYPARVIHWEDDELPTNCPLCFGESTGLVTVKPLPFDPLGNWKYWMRVRRQSPWVFNSFRGGSCPTIFQSENQPELN